MWAVCRARRCSRLMQQWIAAGVALAMTVLFKRRPQAWVKIRLAYKLKCLRALNIKYQVSNHRFGGIFFHDQGHH
jgi:hypothetical protein